MSRILEFQPTDESTVVARILVELHHAIDLNFPHVGHGGRQFTKTVLTNQVELQNKSPQKSAPNAPAAQEAHQQQQKSATLNNSPALSQLSSPLGKRSITSHHKKTNLVIAGLTLTLLTGCGVLLWYIFFKTDPFIEP